MPRAGLSSYSTVNLGYGGASARMEVCYSFFFVLRELTCTCKGASSQSVSLTAIGFPRGDSEETSLDVSFDVSVLRPTPILVKALCVQVLYECIPNYLFSFNREGYSEKCVMNNYFGIGLDAKISLEFNNKREEHPEKCR